MSEKLKIYPDYQEGNEGLEPSESLVDSEREYPLEARCCISGDEVKHSYCRYPDPEQGTMMVMSHESMLKYSRREYSLSEVFGQVLALRRKQEAK